MKKIRLEKKMMKLIQKKKDSIVYKLHIDKILLNIKEIALI